MLRPDPRSIAAALGLLSCAAAIAYTPSDASGADARAALFHSTKARAAFKAALAAKPATPTQPAAVPAPDAPPTAAIDQLVAARWRAEKVTRAPLCDDRTFVRRVYLDLAGRIPTAAEADVFLSKSAKPAPPPKPEHRKPNTENQHPNNAQPRAEPAGSRPAPNARAWLVDALLASPEYAEHMRDVFDVVFMGRGAPAPGGRRRRGGQAAGAGLRTEWLAWLERGFAENRPWDRSVHELVLARPDTPAETGSVWFLYARNNNYQEIAEKVSASLLGVQVDCAQCHNHFLVPEIKQKDYWGLVAFFSRSKNQETKDGPRVGESAVGGFSNYATLKGESFPAELTFFNAQVPEVRPAMNVMQQDLPSLYRSALQNTVTAEPRVPVFSRREQFAEKVLKGNPLVARAVVNRFWELLVGRGFVHPVDKMDSRHPASHPELLDWLAKDFERNGYDIKRLVRAIVLSKPYQLEAKPVGAPRPELFAAGIEKPLSAEQLYRSLMVATTGKADGENPDLTKSLTEAFPDLFPEENVSTLRQAMFLTNNSLVDKLTAPAPGTTMARLVAMPDLVLRVKEAFRVAYGRLPDATELRASVVYLKARSDRPAQATQQFWWALLAGAEFRFNH